MGNFPKTTSGKVKKETDIQLPQTREKENLGVGKDVQHIHQHLCFLLFMCSCKAASCEEAKNLHLQQNCLIANKWSISFLYDSLASL